ncbi:MAG: VanZ family protein [Halioglobus sp.]|nr:VanZ family protein [Halioglobus sp.]
MRGIAVLVYAVFVACVSLMPLAGGGVGQWDKAAHLAMYGLFALLGCWAVRRPSPFFFLCIGIVAYGGLMEILQSLTPARMMSLYDFLANTLGVVLGALLGRSLLPAARRERMPHGGHPREGK